ncbi:MAG TPA: sigma-54 dependent transcriptional regulator [Blastocatellia bacterium]|nr:sigma-54 dependent transcriptional regulator [Blastocatellia bacterium]
MKHILVVDDDRASCKLLHDLFLAQGWQPTAVTTPGEALRLAEQQSFDLLVSDINLEANQNGLDLLRLMRDHCPVILVTGFGTLETTVTASKEGAWDIISKPFKVQEILATVKRALEQGASKDVESVPHPLSAPYESTGMIGRSPSMLELYKEIARVAPSRSTVLIIGESGTGKELVARAIHKHSARSVKSFVPVNCGALTETLLEAELFGHVKGSFTGAAADRHGLWEEASGGTLFLDEIGETSPAMQVKLLRALQEKEIRRVGATKNIAVDARVVAATNRELEQEVAANRFREDLFYRLSVFTLRVPALRERRSDIPLLAEKFLGNAEQNAEKEGLRFQEDTLKVLTAYDWPGNVRELESTVEYAALRARGAEIAPEDLPPKLQSEDVRAKAARSPLTALYDDLPTLDELERRYLLHVLAIVGGSRARAADVMHVDRRTLYRMVERFGIKSEKDQEDTL